MIFNSTEYVARDLEMQKRKLEQYKRELKELPEGHLRVSEKNGKRYYERVDTIRGKRRVRYLGNGNHPEVQQLQKKHFLKKAVASIEKNLPLMEHFLEQYQRIDPNYMQKHFPKAYQTLPGCCFDAADALNLERWRKAPYFAGRYRWQDLRHKTAKGDKVRSKSEVIIANALQARGLAYRYEEEILVNGVTLHPDFCVFDERENRIIFWEHLGMISDEAYRRHVLDRLALYISCGIVPGVNLILTFDDADGNIDSLMIERTLDLWFGAA